MVDLAGAIFGQPVEDFIGNILHDLRKNLPDGPVVARRSGNRFSKIAVEDILGVLLGLRVVKG